MSDLRIASATAAAQQVTPGQWPQRKAEPRPQAKAPQTGEAQAAAQKAAAPVQPKASRAAQTAAAATAAATGSTQHGPKNGATTGTRLDITA